MNSIYSTEVQGCQTEVWQGRGEVCTWCQLWYSVVINYTIQQEYSSTYTLTRAIWNTYSCLVKVFWILADK